MSQREMEIVSLDDCYRLLARRRIGRLVYLDERGPVAVPVNYALAAGSIIFRIGAPEKQAATDQDVLGFEVDQIDEITGTGWSVLVRGAGHEIPITEVPEILQRISDAFANPWSSGVNNVWLRLQPNKITGRRLRDAAVTTMN